MRELTVGALGCALLAVGLPAAGAAMAEPSTVAVADLAAPGVTASAGVRASKPSTGLARTAESRGKDSRKTEVRGWTITPVAAKLGHRAKVRVRVKSGSRFMRRSVVVLRKSPGKRWRPERSLQTKRNGRARIHMTPVKQGVSSFRLRVKPKAHYAKRVTRAKQVLGLYDYGPPDRPRVSASPSPSPRPSASESSRPRPSADPSSTANPSASPGSCRSSAAYAAQYTVQSGALNEISGLVSSVSTPSVFWMHNDSGGGSKLHAVHAAGATKQVVTLTGAAASDWEDIAAGPGPGVGSYLYVADIGDNTSARDEIEVLRVREPAIANGTSSTADFDTLTLTYPDGAHDAETLLVDPATGQIVILTKSLGGTAIYSAEPFAAGDATQELTLRGMVPGAVLITGGDVASDGRRVILRDYTGIREYSRDPADPLWAAFAGPACSLSSAAEPQGEAVGYLSDGGGYLTVSEGVNQPLHYFSAWDS